MAKQELEFFDPTIKGTWVHPEGYPEGVHNLIIAQDPESGATTSFSIWDPGTEDDRVLSHDLWEEIYIIEGDQYVGDQVYTAGMVAVRPPFMKHGPFGSKNGCRIFCVTHE